MQITDIITITELSRLTGKSRPTLYKYISDWESGSYSDIPYLFIQLFKRIAEEDFSRAKLLDYCRKKFDGKPDEGERKRARTGKVGFGFSFAGSKGDGELEELIAFIRENKDNLNLKKIKTMIEETLKK